MPEGWEAEVYGWFSDNGLDEFTENRDDRGGWAPREKIIEALQALGLHADRGGGEVTAKEHDMNDPTEAIRRERLAEINAVPGSREALESQHGQVWDTQQLAQDFEVVGFLAPLVVVGGRRTA